MPRFGSTHLHPASQRSCPQPEETGQEKGHQSNMKDGEERKKERKGRREEERKK